MICLRFKSRHLKVLVQKVIPEMLSNTLLFVRNLNLVHKLTGIAVAPVNRAHMNYLLLTIAVAITVAIDVGLLFTGLV